MSAMSTDAALEALDRRKHETCDRWGHPNLHREVFAPSLHLGDFIAWLVILGAALWVLVQWGIVRP